MKLRLNFLNNNFILINVFEENTAWFNFFKNIKNNNRYFPTVSKKSICPYIPKPDISYVTRLKDSLVNFLKNDIYITIIEEDEIFRTKCISRYFNYPMYKKLLKTKALNK